MVTQHRRTQEGVSAKNKVLISTQLHPCDFVLFLDCYLPMPSLYPSSPARIVPRLLHGAVNRLRGLCLCRHLSGRDPPLAEAAAEKLAWTLLQQDVAPRIASRLAQKMLHLHLFQERICPKVSVHGLRKRLFCVLNDFGHVL